MLVQVELGQGAGRQERGDQLVHHVDRDVVRPGAGPAAITATQAARASEPPSSSTAARAASVVSSTPPTKTTFGWRRTQRWTDSPNVGPVAGGRLQLGEPVVDQVVADVVAPARSSLPAACRRRSRPRAPARSPGGPPPPRGRRVRRAIRSTTWRYSSRVANVIRRVEARRVLPQHRLDPALVLDEGAPVHPGDGAQAGDAVGHHHLGQRQPLGGAGGGLLGAQRLVGDPLLQPDHGGEGAALEPELVQEAGDEGRRERRRVGGEAVQRQVERAVSGDGRLARCGWRRCRPASSSSSRSTVRSAMRRTFSISPSRSMAGTAHSSPIVRVRDLLERLDEEVTLWRSTRPSVWRDQRDGQLVDPRVAGQRAGRPARAARGSSRRGRLSRTSPMCSWTTW